MSERMDDESPDEAGPDPLTLPTDSPRPPTVAIYQNPEHVSGILQQLGGTPLPDRLSMTSSDEDEQSRTANSGTEGGGEAGFDFAGFSAGAHAGGSKRDENLLRHLGGNRSVNEFVYSQAYYLHQVRAELHRRHLVQTVRGRADAHNLRSGTFVEYEAKFSPDQLAAILDVLTPDLVAEGVRFFMQDQLLKGVKSTNAGKREQEITVKDAKESAWTSVANALTVAARADFRSEKTREYYGRIGDHADDESVVAITICDSEHFVVSDEDRILDGRFTVLGKVTEEVRIDLPVLARNKLLDKVNPEFVDQLAAELNNDLSRQATKAAATRKGGADEVAPFTGGVSSRILGPSFKVIPLAIFA